MVAHALLTAGSDDEIFTILGLIVTPLFAYLVYIVFFCNECDECKKKWRKGNG